MANNGRANIDSSNRVPFEGSWDRAQIREADAITPDLLVSLSFQRFVTREVQGQSPPAATDLAGQPGARMGEAPRRGNRQFGEFPAGAPCDVTAPMSPAALGSSATCSTDGAAAPIVG
jgi:hypothetical protein